MDIIELIFTVGFWTAAVRMATPLIFGTLGELICERAGVLNLGIEGIMTFGAMIAWMWVYQGGDLYSAILVAAIAGAIFGVLHSGLTVYLGVSQHVSGIGITLLASSASYFIFRVMLPNVTTPPKIESFEPLAIPFLSGIPFIGPVLFEQTIITYFAFVLIPMFSISVFDAFYFGMINGRGWICVALVIFASWKPGKAFLGTILFAGFDALQIRIQQESGIGIPYQFFLMLPYLLSIAALILISRKAAYPKALLVPFRKGER
ncbi:MAG: ABC transporter permease [Gammaproteobacteria bacterium]|nr:ABC transporter permease [Gammaproteobacteria bacterium]